MRVAAVHTYTLATHAHTRTTTHLLHRLCHRLPQGHQAGCGGHLRGRPVASRQQLGGHGGRHDGRRGVGHPLTQAAYVCGRGREIAGKRQRMKGYVLEPNEIGPSEEMVGGSACSLASAGGGRVRRCPESVRSTSHTLMHTHTGPRLAIHISTITTHKPMPTTHHAAARQSPSGRFAAACGRSCCRRRPHCWPHPPGRCCC